MPTFSTRSTEKLQTCHQDLQTIFNYVIKHFDCTVIHGERTPELQFELYKKGRKQVGEAWVIEDRSKVVTYKDGHIKKSKHNTSPSIAVDVMPYPIEWKNLDRARYFAGYVKGVARMLKEYGAIEHEIIWGNDWDNDTILKDQDFADIPHFQIK
jgi:peptidoglycan L-alanyl-D-glutamate endopeptidase CwlK